jgi:hypothetical protein
MPAHQWSKAPAMVVQNTKLTANDVVTNNATSRTGPTGKPTRMRPDVALCADFAGNDARIAAASADDI